MERVDRFSTILVANEKITAMVRLPLCLQQDQVDMEEVEQLKIPFDSDGKFIILHLKGVIDGGASDTIVTESKLGSIITDVGRKTSVLSVLDESKRYKARKIKGFLKTGETEILIVETMSKPKNNIKLMKMLRQLLGIPKEKYVTYNVDDAFLRKDPEILIGVASCQVFHQKLEEQGFVNDYLHPRLQLM